MYDCASGLGSNIHNSTLKVQTIFVRSYLYSLLWVSLSCKLFWTNTVFLFLSPRLTFINPSLFKSLTEEEVKKTEYSKCLSDPRYCVTENWDLRSWKIVFPVTRYFSRLEESPDRLRVWMCECMKIYIAIQMNQWRCVLLRASKLYLINNFLVSKVRYYYSYYSLIVIIPVK